MADAEAIYDQFESLPACSVPVNLPKGGTTYLYAWNEDTKKSDWRADGYRWRQNGNCNDRKCKDGFLSRKYFKVFDGPKSISGEFTRTAYTRPDKPNSVVIEYKGNELIAGKKCQLF